MSSSGWGPRHSPITEDQMVHGAVEEDEEVAGSNDDFPDWDKVEKEDFRLPPEKKEVRKKEFNIKEIIDTAADQLVKGVDADVVLRRLVLKKNNIKED